MRRVSFPTGKTCGFSRYGLRGNGGLSGTDQLIRQTGIMILSNNTRRYGQTQVILFTHLEFHKVTRTEIMATSHRRTVISEKGKARMIFAPNDRAILVTVTPKNNTVHGFPNFCFDAHDVFSSGY